MNEYMLLFHNDVAAPDPDSDSDAAWGRYLEILRASGAFRGGSVIGGGMCVRKDGAARPIAGHIGGFIRVETANIAAARGLLTGNPVYECGGTVEIRELPRD
jgi:hypothetical protein